MKKILYILPLLLCLNGSCQKAVFGKLVNSTSGGASPVLIIFTGESNSGGIAPNSSATAPELASRGGVQILYNFDFDLQNLDIGVNNLYGHTGLEGYWTDSHGWELQLANSVDSGYLASPVYLVKTGQGGSIIDNWKVGGTFAGTNCWQVFQDRVDTAISQIITLTGQSPQIYVFYSQAINDIIAGTTEATWKTDTKNHIAKIRTKYGANIPFFMTKFNMTASADYTTFNDSIDAIASEIGNCYAIDPTGATYDGVAHWDYEGMKTICRRLVTSLKTNYGL